MTLLTVVKALLTLLPLIIDLVRGGRLTAEKAQSQEEVVDALTGKINERVEAARRARDRVPTDDELHNDPHDRSNRDGGGS